MNLEEGTSRLVSGVEMNRTSRIMRGVREINVCPFLRIPQGEVREISVFGVPFLYIPLHEAFWLCCLYSMVLDPVFLYIPVTNDEKKCFQFDRWVMSVVIAERSAFGIWYLTNRTSEIRESIHRNYSKSLLPVFLLDLSIILPLPQVLVLLAYSQRISGQEFFSLMNLFLVQHGLKVIRLAKLITEWKNSYNLNKWANLTFNFGYLHAANVFGSLWYFFAVQRKAECWKKACTDFTRCGLLPLHCDDSLTNYTFSSDFCSTKTQNATIYDFGIFRDAIQSGVLDQNNFFRRYFPCFQWSLQTLSCFGQGLPLSTNVLENIFVISITITGVVLFFLLIGKVQSETSKVYEIRQKVREIDRWLPFGKLPKKLQKEIKEYQKSKLQTTGVDVEYVVNHLPRHLRNNIKQKLCLDLLKKVEEFGNWSDSSLERLCDVVKPVVFTERSYILREGNPIDQMLFVLQGKSRTYTSRSITGFSSNSGNLNNHLEDGDFSGEELIAWAKADRDSSNLPISTKTIQALTNVEAFVLMADDLKQVLLNIDH
ncbi:cyclic nucleotide-gated ion channel 1-like isoform X2 [Citrus sinensis]|uniref:cyclic nucleotide-gated ion channel 1-like isoform X2 n=1 Tax=Citrus sinensis TaxID=2711 RepID=UPI0022783B8A|nr:cyclic nucleotide-gated ion channel 1-like isoform X2 [Citrus sinensis]